MSQNRCSEFEVPLISVASGGADVEESQQVNVHIAQCEHCRLQFDRLRQVVGAIENQSAISAHRAESTMTPDFHGRLMRRLRAEETGHAGRRHGSPLLVSLGRWMRTPHSAWMAIAATTAAIVVLLALQRFWETAAGRHATPSTGSVTHVQVGEGRGDQPARPAELRRALVRSLDDFDVLLRRNDVLLSMRGPTAGPAVPRSNAFR